MDIMLLLSILSALLPVTVGIVKKKYSLLWCYPLTSLIFDVTNSIVRRVLHMNNGIVANLYMLIELIFIMTLFQKTVIKSRLYVHTICTSLSAFYIANTIKNSLLTFNMFGGSILMLFYILMGISGLYAILKTKQIVVLEKSTEFWYTTAILIYAGGAFLIFLFKQYMVQADTNSYLYIWKYLFYPVNISKNVLLALAIYHLPKSRKFEY